MTNPWLDDDIADPGDPPAPAPRPSPLMSTGEVAELFGRSSRTIRLWIQRGLLRPIRVGRTPFYRRSDIEMMIGEVVIDDSNE